MKKHMKMVFAMFAFIMIFAACSKDEDPILVKYEVITNNASDTYIEWTNTYGAVNGGRLSNAGWHNNGNTYYVAISMEKGHEVKLTAVSTNMYREVEIKLYLNGKLVQSARSDGNIKAEISKKL